MPAEFGKIDKPYFAFLANRTPLLLVKSCVLARNLQDCTGDG
jgi:hypothetical protein